MGTIVLTPTVAPTSGANTMNLSVSSAEPVSPYNFNVVPGTLTSIQVLDTNGSVPTGPIVVDGRSTYAMDVRGLDEFGNSVPILPTWTIDDASSSVSSDGIVTVSNNPVIANVKATFDPFGGNPLTSTAQLNTIPRYTVSVNVTGLVGSTTLALNGVTQAAPITANGVYTLPGYVGDSTTPTISTAAQPFMGACHGGSAFVNGSDVTINVQCYQLMGNSVVSGAPANPVSAVTLAGVANGASFADGLGADVRFNNPRQITTDGKYLYLADYANHRVRRITIATGETVTVAGDGTAGNVDGGPPLPGAIGPRFNGPTGMTTDGTYLYVADRHTIKKIHLMTRVVTTIAGSSTAGAAIGLGLSARFNEPIGLVTDGTDLFVTDWFNHSVRRVQLSTGNVTTLAGVLGYADDVDGSGSLARFNYPGGITADGAYLYVSDYHNHKIRRINKTTGYTDSPYEGTGAYPTGIMYIGGVLFQAYAGSYSPTYGYFYSLAKIDVSTGLVVQGIAPEYTYYPHGISSDGVNIFVSDNYTNILRRYF